MRNGADSAAIIPRDGVEPSRLCYADKLVTAMTPAWIYLRRAKATGEIHEYMWQSAPAGREKRKYAECGLRTGTPEEWFEDLRAFLLSWVEDGTKNRSAVTESRPDTHERHGDEAKLENTPPLLKAEGAITTEEVDPIAVEAYRLLRERFAPLARFAGPLFAVWRRVSAIYFYRRVRASTCVDSCSLAEAASPASRSCRFSGVLHRRQLGSGKAI
ncbi:MAG: hypothetical protein ACRD7E_22505 [Bryobacteraceae bacterium]